MANFLIGVAILLCGILVGLATGIQLGLRLNSEGNCHKMRQALIHAENTFRLYAKLHKAKGTSEALDKARLNEALASEMKKALEG